MPYTQRVISFSTPLNRSIDQLVTDFNAFFAGDQVQFQDADFSRPQGPSGGGVTTLRVLYAESTVGLELESVLFVTDQFSGGQKAQEKFNTYYDPAGGNNCRVPIKVIDITNHELANGNPDTLFVVNAVTDRAGQLGMLGHDKSVYIAEANANIVAGASGAATIFDSNGNQLSAGTTVTNGSSFAWQSGERSYVLFDPTTGELVTLATCNGAPSVLAPDPCRTEPDTPCVLREIVSSVPTTA